MLHIETDGTIKLTRGDTARFHISVVDNISGDPYLVTDTDKITFSVKKNVSDEYPLITKTVIGETMIGISPSDTKEMAFGKYKYDVQLEKANGDIYTIIEPSTFRITQEVTD